MFHFLHQLPSNCVSLLLGAQQAGDSGFIQAHLMKTATAAGNTDTECDRKCDAKPRPGAKTGKKKLSGAAVTLFTSHTVI